MSVAGGGSKQVAKWIRIRGHTHSERLHPHYIMVLKKGGPLLPTVAVCIPTGIGKPTLNIQAYAWLYALAGQPSLLPSLQSGCIVYYHHGNGLAGQTLYPKGGRVLWYHTIDQVCTGPQLPSNWLVMVLIALLVLSSSITGLGAGTLNGLHHA
jgi:hypothetical protein